eukprot:m.231743 g.231743  ORF g.231743 m.231743 type:complete len:80 (-) comp18463_c0_seq1:28-267(-)
MHPNLSAEEHQGCKELIQMLEVCHNTGMNRFTGACNEIHNKLNVCLFKQYRKTRRANHAEARARTEAWKKEMEAFNKDD